MLATQNPIEYEGTYPLPEAQLDRFLLRIGFGYPTADEEWRDARSAASSGASDEVELKPLVDRRDAARDAGERSSRCTWPRASGDTASTLVAATASAPSTAVGASPRGSLALLKLARCRAALRGRDYVVPDDVKAVAVPALAHRLVLRPELWVQRVSAEDVVREVLDHVPTPRAEDVSPPVRT